MKQVINKIIIICFLGLVSIGNASAQVGDEDIFINQPNNISGWTASGGNISVVPGGSTLPTVSSSSATCLSGYTLRIGSNAAYLEISSTTTISRIAFDCTDNSTGTTSYTGVIAYSTDGGLTWCSEADALTFTFIGYNNPCTHYDNSSLPAGINKMRIWRKYVNGGSGVGSGQTIRMGNLSVWSTPLSPKIKTFTVNGVAGTIDDENGTITVELPYGSDLSSLEPVITLGGTATDYSPKGAQDFTNSATTPVVYTVTDDEGNEKTYDVTITTQTAEPDLEFGSITGDNNPPIDLVGPSVDPVVIYFLNNANNPNDNVFTTYTPHLTATFTLTENDLEGNVSTGKAINFGWGGSSRGIPVYRNLGSAGSPDNNGYWTSAGNVTAGTGIDRTSNYSVSMHILTAPLYLDSVPTNSRWKVGTLEINFNRPVNNPVLNFGGLGNEYESGSTKLGFSAEFNVAANVDITLTRLSGSTAFVVDTDNSQINNGSTAMNSSGDTNAGFGSVRVNGTGINGIILELYMHGDGRATDTHAWASGENDTIRGDVFTVGISVAESDLQVTKTVSNSTPTVGTNVDFTITAKNNGASHNTDVTVNDLLPSGYTYVSSTPSTGTYNSGTGVWDIGNLNAGATATLTITATVKSSGTYLNNATISTTSGINDPDTDNNTASVSTSPLCKNYWHGTFSTDWANSLNWTRLEVPLTGEDVEYATADNNNGDPAVNDLQLDQDRTIGSLINATDKRLIIPAAKALTVNDTIIIRDSQNADLIHIQSGGSSTPGGTLIFHNDAAHPVYATVEMYSKAWIDPNGVTNNKYFWQYFGL
nr:DUF11 domain-containing protein [Paludibacteraceae bacterium]